jgi:hypothetical protein
MNFAFGFKGEGPTHCMPLIFTARVGKQNQHGWLETIGAMRNEVCLADWHIYYLFYRWDYNRILADDLPGTKYTLSQERLWAMPKWPSRITRSAIWSSL